MKCGDFLEAIKTGDTEAKCTIAYIPIEAKTITINNKADDNFHKTLNGQTTICYYTCKKSEMSKRELMKVFSIRIIDDENPHRIIDRYVLLSDEEQDVMTLKLKIEPALRDYTVIEGSEKMMERILDDEHQLSPTKKYYLQDLSNYNSDKIRFAYTKFNVKSLPRAFVKEEEITRILRMEQ